MLEQPTAAIDHRGKSSIPRPSCTTRPRQCRSWRPGRGARGFEQAWRRALGDDHFETGGANSLGRLDMDVGKRDASASPISSAASRAKPPADGRLRLLRVPRCSALIHLPSLAAACPQRQAARGLAAQSFFLPGLLDDLAARRVGCCPKRTRQMQTATASSTASTVVTGAIRATTDERNNNRIWADNGGQPVALMEQQSQLAYGRPRWSPVARGNSGGHAPDAIATWIDHAPRCTEKDQQQLLGDCGATTRRTIVTRMRGSATRQTGLPRSRPGRRVNPAQPPAIGSLWRKLRAQRIDPLKPYMLATAKLPAVRHLWIVPPPHLARIPIEVMTDEFTVTYIPSGSLAASLMTLPKRTERSLLAVGDPVYTSDSSGPRLSSLPGTRNEVEQIRGLFASAGLPIDLRIGSSASEQEIEDLAGKDSLRRYSHLHFASRPR